MSNNHPSREECLALLKNYGTPEHVIRHCIKVTDTALKIGQALNDKGCALDLDLIRGAGLIHDIARVEDKHWEVGAKIASELGYQKEAEIIRIHMFYNCNPNETEINETDVICLSDRMVKEDHYVGLDKRMQYILDKFKGNQEAVERISERIKDNKAMIRRIEKRIGTSIDSLISK
ncbi:MAG: HDIG domain-containing protein [Eubacteriales bacterium]|nr:HDIG domain-containing protein [Eubacteriales bacterium]